MAIRFIDTNFFKSPFVRSLDGSLKSLYTFIICDSSAAGIWAADFEIASVYLGLKLDKSKFDTSFIQGGKAVDLGNGRYFFPDFIEHQYPKGLSSQNPAHKNIILELSKYQLIKENEKGAWEVLKRPFEGSQVIVTVIETVNDKVNTTKGSVFKKPELSEVLDYMTEIGHPKEAEKFIDHYSANGWRVGKVKMADWKAACRNWVKRNMNYGTTKKEPTLGRIPISGINAFIKGTSQSGE